MPRLEAVLGRRGVADAATRAGGRTLMVPQRYNADGAFVRLLGPSIARTLIAQLGGSRIYVPRGPSPFNARGKALDAPTIAKLAAKGWTNQRIADQLGCTPRAITAHRAKQRPKE